MVGDSYSYAPKTNLSKARTLDLVGAPAGMEVRNGMVRWDPTDAQAGDYHVTLRASGAGTAVAEQPLNISVVRSTLRADGDVGEEGGSVIASSPDAHRVLGLGVQVPARSLDKNARITVGELERAPAMPNSLGAAVAVRFGPPGQVFGTAAQLTLALPQGVTHSNSRIGVYVYNPAGRWERTPMVGVDLDNGLVTAKAQHFSIYAAIQSSLDMDVTLARAGQGAVCQGALVGSAVVSSPLSEIELGSVNNLSDALAALVASGDPSVQDVLSVPGFSGSLRVVQVLELIESHGDTEVLRDRRLTVTTLYVPGDGSATLTHTDALGNVLAVKQYPVPAAQLDDIALRLRGGANAVHFAGEMDAQLGLAARVHLAYFPGDSSLDPVSVDDLGMAAVERGPTFANLTDSSIADVDCDGLLEPYDSTDDSMVTAIDASPAAIASVFTGDSVTLSARIVRGSAGASGSWTLLDSDGASLVEVPGAPDSRSFQAAQSGRYLVSFRAPGTGGELEHIFAIDVAERIADSAPPSCRPSKELDTGRLGEAVALSAIVSDADSPLSTVRVEWGLVDASGATPALVPASTLLVRGDKALFSPIDEGQFVIGCRAFDGQSYGAVGQVDLSVVASSKNRAPTNLVLSPAGASALLGEDVTFHALADDPDGDFLTYVWNVEGATVVGAPMSEGRGAALHIKANAEGTAKVSVSVTDGKSTAIEVVATLLVGPVPTSTVDADKDGWPAGTGARADCNDADASIHPGAVDLCGDMIDSDCDGIIVVNDCDGDSYPVSQGDCDDADPNVHPGAQELCDGLDNDCNGIKDDRYSIGKQCSVGTGACQASGVFECSVDGLYQLCASTPLQPTPEVCGDRIDNDCDGEVDDANVCTPDAGAQEAGMPDGGPGPADAGVRGVADAMVQSCQYAGQEVCNDGIDNDCDGAVDAKDPDCQMQQPVPADNCASLQTIKPNSKFPGSLDNTHPDFMSACNKGGFNDLIYAFSLAEPSYVSVLFDGVQPFAWSIQTGACDAAATRLSEQFCDTDYNGRNQHQLGNGNYFLVVEGTKGPFDLLLVAKPVSAP
ncbi:MAG: uncharacterized protein JWN48_5247 [Myxococcaceae bacterium]|nr:uncharacterized protein [Myxococcaceae bacterium]